MLTMLRNIFYGLVHFIRACVTIVRYVPRGFRAVWNFFGSLRSLLGVFPAGIAALGLLVIIVAVIYLIIGR